MKMNLEINERLLKDTAITVTDLNSGLWEQYSSGSGSIRDEIEAVSRVIEGEEPADFEDKFTSLCQSLWDQMSFYDASYLAIPYMLKLLDKKAEQQDFMWQLRIISEMGMIVMTDIARNHDDRQANDQVVNQYNQCIEVLAEKTKAFIMNYADKIAELDWNEKSYFYITALAILDDREAAFVLTSFCFDEIYVVCDSCGEYNEEMPTVSEGEIEEIEPAEPLIGKWDGRSLDDTYLWYSNFLHLLRDDAAADALSYYYGTYTCPHCGKKSLVMDLAKRYLNN